MIGLSRAVIETELKQTSLNENDQRIIVNLLVKNNQEIENYFNKNVTKKVTGDIVSDMKRRGMNI